MSKIVTKKKKKILRNLIKKRLFIGQKKQEL